METGDIDASKWSKAGYDFMEPLRSSEAASRGPWSRLEGAWITASIGLLVSASASLLGLQTSDSIEVVGKERIRNCHPRTHETRSLSSTTAIVMDCKRSVGHASGAGGAHAYKASVHASPSPPHTRCLTIWFSPSESNHCLQNICPPEIIVYYTIWSLVSRYNES
ncbi:uncharacterized protein ARMOST_18092 [Armillaria ostoyae]|uniref:Uncharacterized protein n=1 Tax=Armillaria ostoyae TaxID=47428 RepID=A0A284S0T7_ARMOS|nr:uncharacterized protein ARMOST_18092 [Armillaria ostoyae]